MFSHAIILAGGRGGRLKQLTANSSKAMLSLNGQPLISFSLNQLVGRVDNIMVTIGYQREHLSEYLIGQGVQRLFDTTDKGNAWWIFNSAAKEIDEPVLLLPCDIITKIDFDLICRWYCDLLSPPIMLVTIEPPGEQNGDCLKGRAGWVDAIGRDLVTDHFCSGIQVINPSLVNRLLTPCSDFLDVWTQLLEIQALRYAGGYPHRWHTVNTEEDYHKICQLIDHNNAYL